MKSSQFEIQIGNVVISSPLQILKGKLNYIRELRTYFKNAKFIEETKNEEDQENLAMRDPRIKHLLRMRKNKHITKNFVLVHGNNE